MCIQMTDFKSLGLGEALIHSLEAINITTPTPIQEKAIPVALAGRDVLASAQTGTGKTLAYILPLVSRLQKAHDQTALILTPTRELATQVKETVRQLFGQSNAFRLALLIGGESMAKQFAQLRARPRLIVGTPGRICDHLSRGTLKLNHAHYLVLDESDRMLDMGFGDDLEAIVRDLPEDRQTLMFSATLPPDIVRLAKKYLRDPESITIGTTSTPVAKIKQEMVQISHAEKFPRLLKELEEREGSIIVFVKTKRTAASLAERLQDNFHEADAIHGDLRQRERDRVMNAFRRGKNRIMVATDIAARGLDIPQIKHVINYELPQCTEDYIHRIGRTARAGAEGNALCLVSPDDRRHWEMIYRAMNPGASAPSRPQPRSGNFGRRFSAARGDKKPGNGGQGAKRSFADTGRAPKPFWRNRRNGKKSSTSV